MRWLGWDALNPNQKLSAEKPPENVRRSTRLSRRIPVVITSLHPAHKFSGKFETAVINAHGCGIVLPEKIGNGTPVEVQLVSSGRNKKAKVVLAITVVDDASWLYGLEFDSPEGNFWEVEDPPPDWLS
jgi:hypothetical protein